MKMRFRLRNNLSGAKAGR